jgi:hypothetical protein
LIIAGNIVLTNGTINCEIKLVPEVGIEPTHLSVPDFESGASTIKYLMYNDFIVLHPAMCKRCVTKMAYLGMHRSTDLPAFANKALRS